MKVITIVGARPQFVKASVFSRVVTEYNKENKIKINEIMVHTGQHYDYSMSQNFFDTLGIKEPEYNLSIGSGMHGNTTGRMLCEIEKVLIIEKPSWVLVYGDTNSTLAGALAASKLQIPIVHVESGLRSYNRTMPEEINRVLTDHMSSLLCCPTVQSVFNLKNEGIKKNVENIGDVMLDAFLHFKPIASMKSHILQEHSLHRKKFGLATLHRAENTDNLIRLKGIISGLEKISEQIPIILPLHPRTKSKLEEFNIQDSIKNITFIEPVSFFDMLVLEENAKFICTDSGGVQKEAYFCKVPCITLRDETEWVETLKDNHNVLVGANSELIYSTAMNIKTNSNWPELYGDGNAGYKILSLMQKI